MKKLVVFTTCFMIAAQPIQALGLIEGACLKADRKAATRTVCNCVQQVANMSLNRTDQKQAAKFFSNPHLAQETRQSDSPRKERFWLRYKEFGNLAAQHCSSS